MSLEQIKADFGIWLKYIVLKKSMMPAKKRNSLERENDLVIKGQGQLKAPVTKKKKESQEDLEEKTGKNDTKKPEQKIALKDQAYTLIKQLEAIHQHHLYAHHLQEQSINFYESYKNSSTLSAEAEHGGSIKEDTLRDIIEDTRLKEVGVKEGSGKYIRAWANEKLSDYKLWFENVMWIRVKYTLSLS